MAHNNPGRVKGSPGRVVEQSDKEQPRDDQHTRLGYLPGLDGLRAVAVAAVLLYHADLSWFQGGYLGVDLFFVLSGFLISSLLLAEWHKQGRIDLKAFWLRRARRLLPALFLMLGICLTFAVIFLPDEVAGLRNDAIAAAAYVTNWYLIFGQKSYFETVGRPSLFQHLWSLAVEEQFYLLWPLILIFILKFCRRWALPLILVGAAMSAAFMWLAYDPNVDPSRLYYGTDTRAASLLIGAALAFILQPRFRGLPGNRTVGRLVDVAGAAALASVVWFFVTLDETQSLVYQGGMQALEIATAVVILAIVFPGARLMPWLLGGRIMRWVGQRSYGIYLWHWPVFMVTRPELDVMFDGPPLLLLRLGATLLLAELSFKFVETPIRSGSLGRAWRELRAGRPGRAGAQRMRWAGAVMAILGLAILVGVPVVEAKPPPPPDYLDTQGISTVESGGSTPGQGGAPWTPGVPYPGQVGSQPLPTQPDSYSDVPSAPAYTDTPQLATNTATVHATATSAPMSPTNTIAAATYTEPPATNTATAVPRATKTPLRRATATRTPTIAPETATPIITATSIDTATETPATASVPTGVPTGESPATELPTAPTGSPMPEQSQTDTPQLTTTPDGTEDVPTAQPTPSPQKDLASLGRITAIGDSVMLGDAPVLKQLGTIYIDAAVGRQVSTAISLLNTYHSQGRLGSVVLIHMGNNGTFSAKQFDQIMTILSDEKYVVFVNLKVPRSWEAPNNNVIMNGVAKYPNAFMVDWRAVSINHPEYFAKDGYHLQVAGMKVYTNLIGEKLLELANR